MSSEARINASRENGKKGGVRTESGKARSCLNALKHGHYARKAPVTCTEDEGKYETFRQEMIASFQPADRPEEVLVDKIAESMWRLDRYECSQEYFIDFEIHLQLDELEKDNEDVEIHPELRTALALHACFSSKNSALVEQSRFTSRLSRKLHRYLQELAELQGPRFRSGPKPQPQPQPDDQPPATPGQITTTEEAQPEPVKKSENEPRSPLESAPPKLPTLPALSRTVEIFRRGGPLPAKIRPMEEPLKAMTA